MHRDEVDPRLGVQLWVERDDSAERVAELVGRAAEVGIGALRVFLMWPWIQAQSRKTWDFRVWDAVFDAASQQGIGIKATLTANSGPWWLGTESVLHSHTLTLREDWLPAQEEYVKACVQRYASHPALTQWILWNEPNYPYASVDADLTRPVGARAAWIALLDANYDGAVERLNERWRTGYTSFADVPFVQELADPAHRSSHWRSWRPMIDDYALRATLLEGELARVSATVRTIDQKTPLCINPNQTLNNHAQHGYRLEKLAANVDVLGASFHAPWSFSEFAQVDDHASLIVAGVGLLQNVAGAGAVEVTEAQTGNTFYAGVNPLGVGAAEISATYLAPLLAGAESVTGWCFNTRRPDFEAGEWGLLNDDDSIGDRARAVTKVGLALRALDASIGHWEPGSTRASVAISDDSQAVQFAMSQSTDAPWSTRATSAIHGSALATIELNRLGVRSTLWPVGSPLPTKSELIVALGVIAWSAATVERMLDAVARGATLLIDGTSGQFDLDISLNRPWPGAFAARTGLRSKGLETAVVGGARYDVRLNGHMLGSVTGVRADVSITDSAWTAIPSLVYAQDAAPVMWERTFGEGRLIYCTASLATSVLEAGSPRQVAAAVLATAADRIAVHARPLSPATTILEVHGARGTAYGVFAPQTARRRGEPFAVSIPPGSYTDLWSEASHHVEDERLVRFDAPDGIAILVRNEAGPATNDATYRDSSAGPEIEGDQQ